MKTPWLSAIVPCRNGERWLATALRSVADQHMPGIEVILIDGSDTVKCLEIAETFADRLDLRIYRRPDLHTWTAKTNFGVRQARAEWVCMLHIDDFWLPGRGAALRRWLASDDDVAMHLHPAYIVDHSGEKLGLWRCPLPYGAAPVRANMLLERLLVQNFIAIPAPTIRRDAFLAVGGLDDALWHTADWDLYLKISSVGAVCYHADPLACFRIHGNSLTVSGSRHLADFRKQHEIVSHRHAGRLPAGSQKAALRLAGASAAINAALAEANNGRPAALLKAARALLGLRPWWVPRYLSYSRIIERVVPRIRARLAGEW